MPRYKLYDYSQLQMIPVSLDGQLMTGTLEHAIHYLIEERLDLSVFDQRYCNDEMGRCAYDPKVLLKVVLLAYSRGITGSRRIERACRQNVVFMALTCGQSPDHSTLAAFVSSMGNEVPALFAQVLLVCDQEGLLGGTHFSLDGVKLPSNASKEWSGTSKELRYKQEKLQAKVLEAVREHRQADREEDHEHTESDRGRRKRRIERLRGQAERIEKFLKQNGPRQGVRGQEIKSNVTDNESAYLKSSHGLVQGYNAQALVDAKNQVITCAQASSDVQDFNQMARVIPEAGKTAEAAGLGDEYYHGKILSADSNFHSERNLEVCEEHKLDAYIPDTHFRKRDVRFASRDRHRAKGTQKFGLKDFRYDALRDHYVCPRGELLRLRARRQRCGSGWGRWYKASERKCRVCPYARQCLQSNARARSLLIPNQGSGDSASRRMVKKIDTARGRLIYQMRLAICEPVFANLRAHKGMDRFTLRGRKKVDIQWKLYCMVHNIGKIMNFSMAFG